MICLTFKKISEGSSIGSGKTVEPEDYDTSVVVAFASLDLEVIIGYDWSGAGRETHHMIDAARTLVLSR